MTWGVKFGEGKVLSPHERSGAIKPREIIGEVCPGFLRAGVKTKTGI
jgi:hypothetical protein